MVVVWQINSNLNQTFGMPVNKNAMLRYRIIDSCLTNNLRKYPSLQDIIAKIEDQLGSSISISMVNKDLSQMRSLYGAPIKYSQQHGGYFYEEDGYSIIDQPLTPDELAALDYSTALLNSLKGTHLFKHFENAINKLIQGYRISSVLEKSSHQILDVEKPLSDGGSDWLKPILEKIVNRESLRFAYKRFDHPEKEYLISPYLLKEYRSRWYVIGAQHSDKNLRVFALDRLQDILYSEEAFLYTDNFNPQEYFNYSFGITQVTHMNPEEVELLFDETTAHYIRSMPLHHSQRILKEDEHGLQVKLTVYPTRELIMSILSYGKGVKVLGSEKLKKLVKEEIVTMAKQYNYEV